MTLFRDLTCPNCSGSIPRLTLDIVKPFRCPRCNAQLCVPFKYRNRIFVLTLIGGIMIPYGAGARGASLLVAGIVVGYVFGVVITLFTRRILTPTLLICNE